MKDKKIQKRIDQQNLAKYLAQQHDDRLKNEE